MGTEDRGHGERREGDKEQGAGAKGLKIGDSGERTGHRGKGDRGREDCPREDRAIWFFFTGRVDQRP